VAPGHIILGPKTITFFSGKATYFSRKATSSEVRRVRWSGSTGGRHRHVAHGKGTSNLESSRDCRQAGEVVIDLPEEVRDSGASVSVEVPPPAVVCVHNISALAIGGRGGRRPPSPDPAAT
jgi:hypothetical protein